MTPDAPDAPDGPSGLPTALQRPDGGWQVGVGPGAVVVRTSPSGEGRQAGPVLGPALAGLVAAGSGVRDGGARVACPACPVVGAGELAARLRRALGERSPEAGGPVQVVVHQHVVPPDVGVALAGSGRVTVPVVVQRHRVLVGPVVGLGDGPCLHCLDLHRRDRDDAWPVVATALGHPAEQVTALAVGEPLARATEGLVLLLVSSVLAGGAVSVGLAHELGAGAPHVVARRWTRHPGCHWHP